MSQIAGQFSNIWKGTSFGQRLVFIVVILGFIAGLLAVTYWVRTPDYGLLYSDLGQKEASEIVTYLRDNNINYKLKDNGSTILVPSNKIYESRMALAKDSLPGGEVGFELFDRVKFGMSDLAQKVNYRRALQGELSKTISQLDDVEWAKVQIVIPEPSLFVEDEKHSTASVVLKMRKRHAINPGIIAGITHLVSTSVEGLSPDSISITDSKGNLLSKTGESKLSGVITNQFDLSRKLEEYYASKAMSIIEKITGPGKAIVKVSADLDFKHIDEKQIEYDQDKKVPVSQVITTQSTEMPGAANGDAGVKMSKEAEETETTQYALSKVERAISEHEAGVKRLTVAVLVDGNYVEEETTDGKITSKYVSRTDDELDQIAAIVKQAIGIDESAPRNDKFEIQSVKFQQHVSVFVDEEAVEKEDKKDFILSIARSSSLVIAVLAFLFFATRTLKRVSLPTQPIAAGYATYASPAEIEDGDEDMDESARNKKEDEKRLVVRDGIIDNAKEDPRTTSNLVRKWLRESE
ncbi:flagellar biosynthesis/type III secretory system lipoprotein [Candidatus Scalindua japonica]|uniref:Flagellar M-ring protein n=1 Tax=Candidatus Scalindua japonica TaxID=1284222 RepID=A0A286TVZ2_9BACT|nr:flagellar basal-body MS-ring/collar protein FliF [Candidatus Scalindua japonica]GAX60049.1 flagellar biosynthesis/type III secretory system lipoprotein [Candidatus Scalindua japonica]